MYYPVGRPTRCTPFFIITHNRITFDLYIVCTPSFIRVVSIIYQYFPYYYFFRQFHTSHNIFLNKKTKHNMVHNSPSPKVRLFLFSMCVVFVFLSRNRWVKIMVKLVCMMLKTILFVLFLDG